MGAVGNTELKFALLKSILLGEGGERERARERGGEERGVT